MFSGFSKGFRRFPGFLEVSGGLERFKVVEKVFFRIVKVSGGLSWFPEAFGGLLRRFP